MSDKGQISIPLYVVSVSADIENPESSIESWAGVSGGAVTAPETVRPKRSESKMFFNFIISNLLDCDK